MRSRVLGAKLIASLVLALATLVMSVAVVAAGVLVASPGVDGTWSDAATLIGQSAVFLTTGMVVGVAFGAVLLASTPAMVALFALPIAWTAVASLSFFADAAPWLDTRLALDPLHEEVLSATQWAQAGTALALWMLLPLSDRHLADHAAGGRPREDPKPISNHRPAGRTNRRCPRHARPAACDAVLALNPPRAGHRPARCAHSRCSRDRCENSVINLRRTWPVLDAGSIKRSIHCR